MNSKKKRGWKKYNEELVRRGELLFDPDFYLDEKGEELNRLNEKKGRAKVSLSKLINEYARSHSCMSSSLQTDRGVSESIRRARRRIRKKTS